MKDECFGIDDVCYELGSSALDSFRLDSFRLNMEAVGRRIDRLFRQYGITTKQMSDALHVTYQCVDKWRKGKSLPETHNLVILARLFGVDIEEMISGEFNQKETNSDNSNNLSDINSINNNLNNANSIISSSLADIITKINKVKKYNALRTDLAKSITLIDRVFFLNMQIDSGHYSYDNSFLSILYDVDYNGPELYLPQLYSQELSEAATYINGLYIDIDNSIVDSPKDKRYAFYFKSVSLHRLILFVPKLDGL